MRYELTPIEKVTPYDKNPRIIPDEAVDQAARSISAFGFIKPIIVNREGIIIAGHTRLKAAKKLGLEVVPVLWVDTLTDAQERAYRIADNKLGENTQWDRLKFDAELAAIVGAGLDDVEAIGLEQWELDRLSRADEDENNSVKTKSAPIDAPIEAQPKKYQPPQMRVLIVIEDDEDEDAVRKGLKLKKGAQIPSVIKFSEVKK